MRRSRRSLAFLIAALALMAFPASAVEVYETIYGEFVPVENARLFVVELSPGTGLPGEDRPVPPRDIRVKPGPSPILASTGMAAVNSATPAGFEGGVAGAGFAGRSNGFGRSPDNVLDLRVRQARKALDS